MTTKDIIADGRPVYIVRFPGKGYLMGRTGYAPLARFGYPIPMSSLFPSILAARKALDKSIKTWEQESEMKGHDGDYYYAESYRKKAAELANIGRTTADIVRVDFTPVG